MQEIEVLKVVCLKLEREKIPYMVTGSFAANFYAVPRMTRDLDIIVEIQKPDVKKIHKLFADDFYIDADSISEAIDYQGIFNILHNETVFKVDFIIRKNSRYRQVEFQRKNQILVDEIPIWVVSLEDLIISKLLWGKEGASEMQLRDVKNLFQSSNDLDRQYIESWIVELDLNDIYAKVRPDDG